LIGGQGSAIKADFDKREVITMNRKLQGMALAAMLGTASPAAAQNISVNLRLGDGPVRVAGSYASRPQYAIPQRFHCEAEGRFLYCWDQRAYWGERPVVYVYPANQRFAGPERHYRWNRDDRKWRKEARKAMMRWRRSSRFRDGDIRVVLAWER
jgi:hypothetical protein